MRTLLAALTMCLLAVPVQAQYSGGTGEPNDPYQIATAADLIALGETPDDYDKHFILIADIDLDPNLPGGKVFDKAVIAPDTDPNHEWSYFPGTSFTGVFDGNGHTISHLTIAGKGYLGLFGQLGSGARVSNLGLEAVEITGTGSYVGGLVGRNYAGYVTGCWTNGIVTGVSTVGGLVGANYTRTYELKVFYGHVEKCYSTAAVNGEREVGGLSGMNIGEVTDCYSTGGVGGDSSVGGLVGTNWGSGKFWETYMALGGLVARCYSTGVVSGRSDVGGLVGSNHYEWGISYVFEGEGVVSHSFWDIEASGQATSAGGTGKTTGEMHDIHTYQEAGWDFWGEREDGLHEIWQMPKGGDYPVLAIFEGYTPRQLQGRGTLEEPYLIHEAMDLGVIHYYSPFAHYRLALSIDVSGIQWGMAVIPRLSGTFDGNSLTISHLTMKGGSHLGFIGYLKSGAEVTNIELTDVVIDGIGDYISGLVGENNGSIVQCSSTGAVCGNDLVGGLVGWSHLGTITRCSSASTVSGITAVGGLVGATYGGTVAQSYSTGSVNGTENVGGLVGFHYDGTISNNYSTSVVHGNNNIAGLVGQNVGNITSSYSTGRVNGDSLAGGLVGESLFDGIATVSFWDIQTSRQTKSDGGTGKTTAEMQTAKTFLDAGWDFVGETVNGTEDIWWIDEGKDYPRLWWELDENEEPNP